jgi:hypothetical protein
MSSFSPSAQTRAKQRMSETTRRQIQGLKRDLKKIFKWGTELDFMQILRENGIKDEDPDFAIAVRLWREQRRGKL